LAHTGALYSPGADGATDSVRGDSAALGGFARIGGMAVDISPLVVDLAEVF
jgi:hypothetical protein